VDYDALTRDPEATMRAVYGFLEEDYYAHDFDNVEHVTWENDEVHGYAPGALHGIRATIKPQPPQWPGILGKEAAPYDNQKVW
jgi:hypothetical protein